jgi:hypothetical protein
MKICSNVEVSGITHVVFYHDTHWVRIENNNSFIWMRTGVHKKAMLHEHMLDIIRRKINNPRYRMWVHNETMNIERTNGE